MLLAHFQRQLVDEDLVLVTQIAVVQIGHLKIDRWLFKTVLLKNVMAVVFFPVSLNDQLNLG